MRPLFIRSTLVLALVAGASAAAERSVECPKEHPASILGRVLGPDGEPVAGAKVTLPGGDSSQVLVVDNSGRFAFYCVVASANYELEVEARGFETKLVSPVVAAAPPQEIEVILSPGEDAPPNQSFERTRSAAASGCAGQQMWRAAQLQIR